MKRVAQLVCFTILAVIVHVPLSAHATGITFLKDGQWSLALAKAKMLKKPIFVFGHTTWCGYCKQMDKEVLTSAEAGSAFNSAFINVSLDMEKGDGLKLSKLMNITAFPALLFFNSNGEVLHKTLGATDFNGLMYIAGIASDPNRQFYTLKKQISAGTLRPADLKEWLVDAQDLKEPGLDGLLSTYLAKQPSIVKNADLLDIFLRYKCLPTKPQMTELYDFAAKSKVERSLRDFMLEKLHEKLTNMAYDKSFNRQSKELNFEAFKIFIAEFRPEIAARETQKQKIVYYTGNGNYKQASIELLLFIESPEFKPGVRELSQMMKKYSSMLRKNGNLELFVKKVDSYILKPEDKMNGSYKTMALMYLYDDMENQEMVNQLAKVILNDKNAPTLLKEEALWLAD